jgi:hypothetical protein
LLDVHAPHESMHGWRDFFLHLTTITIGLLIALSLEGLVEWQHRRHLVHDAEASLHAEIKGNAGNIDSVLADLHKRQATLKHDVYVLNYIAVNGKYPEDKHMSVDFRIVTFADVSWKTAESTGALSYIPYDLAQQYAGIYKDQDLLAASEQQSARDAVVSIGPFINEPDNGPPPSRDEARSIIQNIEVLQGQLLMVDAFMQSLSTDYKQFLAAHPN